MILSRLAARSCFPLPFRAGGDKENRTPDPLLAKQVLSQLSYTPAVGFQVQPLVSLCEVPSTTFVAMDLQN